MSYYILVQYIKKTNFITKIPAKLVNPCSETQLWVAYRDQGTNQNTGSTQCVSRQNQKTFFQRVLSENGANRTSQSVFSRGNLPADKTVRHKTDHNSPSGIAVQKMSWPILPLIHTLSQFARRKICFPSTLCLIKVYVFVNVKSCGVL